MFNVLLLDGFKCREECFIDNVYVSYWKGLDIDRFIFKVLVFLEYRLVYFMLVFIVLLK